MTTPPTSTFNYIPDPGLESVVDLMLDLQMPLLVTGQPGTGKTRLVEYIAAHKLEPARKARIFNTKTSSQAQDLFYTYDALRHFRDAGLAREQGNKDALKSVMDYIHVDALGLAILESATQRPVVLIDEIDKAPRDFPNDILFEFEKFAFKVKEATPAETKAWVEAHYPGIEVDQDGFIHAKNRPVLILTSNSEKNLPDAFMRRVLYHHINFPKPARLKQIIEANVNFPQGFDEKLVNAAIKHFNEIRDHKRLRKAPATAELLSWIHVLHKDRVALEEGLAASADQKLKALILKSYALLAKNKEDLDILKNDLGIKPA
jgi:MoxR-like ATPase